MSDARLFNEHSIVDVINLHHHHHFIHHLFIDEILQFLPAFVPELAVLINIENAFVRRVCQQNIESNPISGTISILFIVGGGPAPSPDSKMMQSAVIMIRDRVGIAWTST